MNKHQWPKLKKLISLLPILFFYSNWGYAETPPQIINKLCSANTFFSQIQPGPGNINCTQPTYSGISGTPSFIQSIQLSAGNVSLVNDSATPGNLKYYGTDLSGVRGFFTFPQGVRFIGTLDSETPDPNGAVISGFDLILQSASVSDPGLVNIGAQTFAGNKTFGGTITANNFSGSSSGANTGDVTIGSANGLSLVNQVLSLALSSTSTTGALSSTNWNTFNNKQDALSFTAPIVNTLSTVSCNAASGSQPGCLSSADWTTFNNKQTAGNYITALTTDVVAAGPGSVAATIQAGVVSNSKLATMAAHTVKANTTGSTASPSDDALGTVSEATSSVLTLSGWTDATIGSPTIEVKQSTSLQSGYLSSTDWSTFNSKQAAGNYITALTGDGTASGPGSVAFTLATVNSNVGSFGSASNSVALTVNGKGLVTAASATAIQIAESQVTNLVSDLAGKQATGNYITALTGDVSASGPGSAASTLATVNSNVGTFASVTVNGKGLVTAATALSGDATTSSAVLTLATVNANVGNFAAVTVNGKGLVTAASALSGDATTSGAALTLATVNANVGSFGSSTAIPNFTVNGKGLITAAGSSVVIAPAGTLTGTTLASNVVTSSLTTVGTIGTGVWQGTAVADGFIATSYIKADGTRALTANWGAGAFSGTFNSVAVGSSANTITALRTVASDTTLTFQTNGTTTAGSISTGQVWTIGATGSTATHIINANILDVTSPNGTNAVVSAKALGANDALFRLQNTGSTVWQLRNTAGSSDLFSIISGSVTAVTITQAGAFSLPAHGTTASAANTFIDSSTGLISRSTSSRRYKENIRDLEIDSSKIFNLRPVSFVEKATKKERFGLIAEEVDQVLPALVEYAPEKMVIKNSKSSKLIPESVQYPMLSVLLLKEVKKLRAEVNALKGIKK